MAYAAMKPVEARTAPLASLVESVRNLVAALPAGVVTCDRNGLITFFNERAANLWGRRPIIGDPEERFSCFRNEYSSDGTVLDRESRPMAMAIALGEPVLNREVIGERPDGSRISLLMNAVPLRDICGAVNGATNTIVDITPLKEAEQALQTRTAELDSLFAYAPLALAVFDRGHRFVRVNEELCRMDGLPEEAHLGRSISEVLPVNGPTVDPILEEVFTTGKAIDRQVAGEIPKDPGVTRHWLTGFYPIFVGRNEISAVGAFVVEITERKRAEQALEASERRYRAIFDAAAVGIGRVRFADARWIDANEAFCRMVGYTQEELLSTPWPEITHPEDVDLDLVPFRRMAAGELANYTVEKRFVHKDGHLVWARLSLSLVRDAVGRPDYEVAIIEDISESRRAEEALKAALQGYEQQNRLFDAVASTTLDFVYVFDCEGRFRYANRRLLEVLGMELPQVIGKTCRELGYEQWQHDMHMRGIAQVVGTKRAVKGEVPFRAPRTGIFGVYEYIFTPVLGPHGEVELVAGTTRDVTERKRAEQKIRESKDRLELVIHAADLGTWDWDIASGELTWSDRCMELFGLPAGTPMTYDRFIAGLSPEDREPVERAVRRSLELGAEYKIEMRAVWPDGNVQWLSSRGRTYRDESGRPVRMSGIAVDIGEAKAAAAALRESEARYRSLFESMQEPFLAGEIITGAAGEPVDWRYLELNPAYERMFGRKRDELVGRRFREVFPDSADWEYWVQHLGRVANTGAPARLEHYGSDIGLHLQAFAYSPHPGQFAAVFADITENKQAEERLRQQQKLESIGLLASGVAHDFNNLLTVIMGSASSALYQCPSCERSRAIVSAAERAASLTKQLLAYAGKGQFVKKTIDLSDLVLRSRPLLSASVSKRVNLILDLADGLPAVEEDPSRVEQILLNLVINAGEAIPPRTDGRIEIRTGACDVTREQACQRTRYEAAPGTYVMLEVQDNGTGMDEDTLAHMLDPFFSTKFTGRGLGLAAVDGIVRSSKGFIDVRSKPGQGTAFQVFLPASEKRRTQETRRPVEEPSRRCSGTVLVVDDEGIVRRLAKMILSRRGYQVLEATDGKHALQLLANSVPMPSVVLLDLAMPVMGGEELIPILARKCPNVKVIVSSGYPEEQARNAIRSASVAGFLQKPYTAAMLTNKIDEILSGRT